jgi:predicted amidohydrolase
MTRFIKVAAAQLGPVSREDPRPQVVSRMTEMMREAHAMDADIVVYPELALTAFFTKWYIEDEAGLEAEFFESAMPNAVTRPLFETARELGIGFHLGYAELVEEAGRRRRFNTAILVDKKGEIFHKYRKIHLPGHPDFRPDYPIQDLEKRYFEVGDLGFKVCSEFGGILGVIICNDRRWPESYRVLGLQGVEMIFCGYNTPFHNPMAPEHDHLADFHNLLPMQAGAYQNGTWVVGVAKCGNEDGWPMVGQSSIISPSGEIVAMCATLEDEIAFARCDLDLTRLSKQAVFNFAAHRRPEHYGLICQVAGALEPGSGEHENKQGNSD